MGKGDEPQARSTFGWPIGLMALVAMLLVAGACGSGGGQGGSLVMASWGGEYSAAVEEELFEPFSEETGISAQTDDAPGQQLAKLQAMDKAGNVTWDIVDLGQEDALALGEMGLVRKLPDDVKADLVAAVGKENVTDYGISFASYADVFVCSTESVSACPENSEQFWDVQQFEGRRTMYADDPLQNVVYALEADGVPENKLFPPDLDRAFAKLDEIKPHVDVWWSTGDQSQQIFRDEEVNMGIMWDGRASQLGEQGVEVSTSYDGTMLSRDLLVVPTDAPNPEAAFEFLRWYANSPKEGAAWMERMRYGVANPKAMKYLPDDVAALIVTNPKNMSQVVPMDVEWAVSHREELTERWNDWLSE